MNCRGWNPHIALYAEGDLDAKLAGALEQHLLTCEECTNFLDELRSTQRDLLQLKTEIIDEAALRRVRGRVLEQVGVIERRRTWLDRLAMLLWGGLRWRYAVMGGLAAAAIVLATWRLTHVPLQSPVALAPFQSPQPVPPVEPAAPAVAGVRKTVRPRQPAPKITAQAANTAPSAAPSEVVAPPDIAPALAAPAQPENAEGKETLVQILTEDPNVVIYWLIDRTGGF